MSFLIDNIKISEGFVNHVYQDHLGKDTIGYGTLMPLSKQECELLLIHRLDKMKAELLNKKPIIDNLDIDKQDVLYEMAYQMGVNGVLNFKNMWKALEVEDYNEASRQMLDSRWSEQTPERAYKLAKIMKG